MKAQLIIFKDRESIIVSDEKINDNDFMYRAKDGIVKAVSDFFWDFKEPYQKIIAGIPGLPSVDFSALSEEDCKKIGWIDLDKLTTRFTAERDSRGERDGFMFKEGLKTMQALNDKKFSEKLDEEISNFTHDLRESASTVNKQLFEGVIFGLKHLKESLSQPKVFDIEVEMSGCNCQQRGYGVADGCAERNRCSPKIDNNSIKITKVL